MKDQLEQLVAQMFTCGILYSEACREFKKRFIIHILQVCKGNQCKAARELGMHRNTLSRTLYELKLDAHQFREGPVRIQRVRKPPDTSVSKSPRWSWAEHERRQGLA